MKDSGESSTALGLEERECVYVYVPAGDFGANSLWFDLCNRLLLLSTSRSTTAAITTTTAVTILLGHLMSILVRGLVDSPESSTALGIKEPECEYAWVRASEFDTNSLWFEVCVLYVYP